MKRTTPYALIAVVAVIALVPIAANADSIRPTDRATFHKLVNERNTLHRKLSKLDRRAADRLKRGDKPVSIHADQVATQDKLDLVELRLEAMAARFGLEVPAVPKPRSPQDAALDSFAQVANRAFSRGRNRAMDELRRQTLDMLRTIDFTLFLEQ